MVMIVFLRAFYSEALEAFHVFHRGAVMLVKDESGGVAGAGLREQKASENFAIEIRSN